MAEYSCQTTSQDLWRTVGLFCKEYNIELSHTCDNNASLAHNSWARICCVNISINQEPDGRETNLVIKGHRNSRYTQLRLILKCLSIVLGLAGWTIMEKTHHGSTGFILMGIGVTLMMLSVILFWIPYQTTHSFMSRLLKDIQSKYSIRQLRPFEFNAEVEIAIVSVLGVLIMAYLLGPMLGSFLMLSAACIASYWLCKQDAAFTWRRYFHELHAFWVTLASLSSLAIGIMFNTAITVYKTTSMESIAHVGSSAARQALLQDGCLIIMFMGLIAYLQYYFSCSRAKAELSSRTLNPVNLAQPIAPYTGRQIWMKINIILSTAITWIYVLIAIEGLVFFLFNRTIMPQPISRIFELYVGIAKQAGVPKMFAHWFVASIVFLLTAPAVATLLVNSFRLLKLLGIQISLLRGISETIPTYHLKWLNTLCRNNNMPVPQVKIVDAGKMQIYAEGGLLKKQGRIFISKSCFEYFRPEDINALLAHEIAHIKNDTYLAVRLKWLSVLTLSPFYYLFMLYDFPGKELQADQFAVDCMGSPKALQSALTGLELSKNKVPSKLHITERIWVFSQLRHIYSNLPDWFRSISNYYDDSLYSTAYPSYTERLEQLDNFDFTSINKEQEGL